MGKLTLLLGGARSGKSTLAEKLAAQRGRRVLYVATALPFDDEMKRRIQNHQEQRPHAWKTVEAPTGIGEAILDDLKSVGWSIWPFDKPTNAMVVEIYPGCLFERKVTKSDALDREMYLRALEREHRSTLEVLDRWFWARAMASDDAFDAFVSCIAMARAELRGGILGRYRNPLPAEASAEGWIWGTEVQGDGG